MQAIDNEVLACEDGELRKDRFGSTLLPGPELAIFNT